MRKGFLLLVLVVLSVIVAFLMSYSVLDIIPIYYDVFGNTLAVMGGLYLVISLILFVLKKKSSSIFFISGLTLLIVGAIISIYFYGYSSASLDTSNI